MYLLKYNKIYIHVEYLNLTLKPEEVDVPSTQKLEMQEMMLPETAAIQYLPVIRKK